MLEYYLIIISIFLLALVFKLIFSSNLGEKLIISMMIGSFVILFIAAMSGFKYYNFYIDISIIYAFFGFIVYKSIFKFIHKTNEQQNTKITEEN
jgi:multisubunit Na+/H+ antiporter MnhF subunit